MFFYKLKIFLLRLIGYEKPIRVAFLKYLTLKFKTFRPHYETILLESCYEAKLLGYDEVSVIELGVAGGNGVIALEKYKLKIQKLLNIKINIYGFDTGEGLPKTNSIYDLPFYWKENNYKVNKNILKNKINSKIYYGDITNTIDKFIIIPPKNIVSIFFDLDLYTSTKNFLDQIYKIEDFLCPRVYCYFDNIFCPENWISQFNGELLAINEFNQQNNNIKIGHSVDSLKDFRFPLAKNLLFMMHVFNHKDYNKYIGHDTTETHSYGNSTITDRIL
jgi:hypothetical protein